MASKNIAVLLVDDHALVRTGLKALLSSEPDITISGEASSGEAALKMVRDKKPNIVLMDVMMGGIGGREATKRLLHSFPDVRVVILTACDQDPTPAELIQSGAAGFLSKDCSSQELLQAIREVARGKRFLSDQIAQKLAIRSVTQKSKDGNTSQISSLSDRERQILIMLGGGLKIGQIAEKLNVTTKTVNTYRYRLYRKLEVKTDVELTHIAIRHNLVDIDKRKSIDEE